MSNFRATCANCKERLWSRYGKIWMHDDGSLQCAMFAKVDHDKPIIKIEANGQEVLQTT
jgi:hypothetical protein